MSRLYRRCRTCGIVLNHRKADMCRDCARPQPETRQERLSDALPPGEWVINQRTRVLDWVAA